MSCLRHHAIPPHILTPAALGSQSRDQFSNNRTVPANCAPGSPDAADEELCHAFRIDAQVDVEAPSQAYNDVEGQTSFDS
eukprot:SAG22_NODE_14671_length_368_cov_0.955390_1_plen_79_part_10